MPAKSTREDRGIYVVEPDLTDDLAHFEYHAAIVDRRWTEVADALIAIHDRKSYRAAGFTSFAECIRSRFDYSRSRAYQLMAAATQLKALSPAEKAKVSTTLSSVVDTLPAERAIKAIRAPSQPPTERELRADREPAARTFTPVPKPTSGKRGHQDQRQRFTLDLRASYDRWAPLFEGADAIDEDGGSEVTALLVDLESTMRLLLAALL